MARRQIKSGSNACLDQLRVELIPSTSIENADQLRIQEIRHLVTRMVLFGRKRGRPSKKNEDLENAA